MANVVLFQAVRNGIECKVLFTRGGWKQNDEYEKDSKAKSKKKLHLDKKPDLYEHGDANYMV